MQVAWRGQNWSVERTLTAGDYWDWLMAVREAIRAESEGRMYLHDVRRWLTSMVNQVMPTEPATTPENHLIALGERIIAAHSAPIAAVEVRYRIDKVDISKLPRPCDCLRCQGLRAKDDGCLFLKRNIDDHDRRISTEFPELIAAMWNQPYSLYSLAVAQKRCEMLASFAEKEGNTASPVGTSGRSPEELKAQAKRDLRRGRG
jgi:hypothetical protein